MKIRILTAGAATLLVALGLVGCTSASSENVSAEETTITYWATDQGAGNAGAMEILAPEIAKFEEQTGINVKVEVSPWSDLTPNTLTAAVSGQGPDVLDIGNTNAVTFQSTGAFYEFDDEALQALGGKDRFVDAAFATTAKEGEIGTSVPLYSQVYALYYNKEMLADAGIEPPATWEELVSAAKTLTKPDSNQYGVVFPGGTVNSSMHVSFILSEQNGGSAFDDDGNPTFTSQGMVDGVKQYVDLLSEHHVMNPIVAEYTDAGQAAGDFARGDAAMFIAQAVSAKVLGEYGMDPSAWGIVPIPAPEGGEQVGSHVAGTNMSIFSYSKNIDAALEFVKFMTSDEEQEILSGGFKLLPAVKGATATLTDDQEKLDVWTEILADHARPLPLVPSVQAFQTNVGGAVVQLIARAATGKVITEDDVRTALEDAQQKMGATD